MMKLIFAVGHRYTNTYKYEHDYKTIKCSEGTRYMHIDISVYMYNTYIILYDNFEPNIDTPAQNRKGRKKKRILRHLI